MRKVFELTFAGEDITVITHDGAEGAAARARELRPQVVIVDGNLGGAAGYDVVRALRAESGLGSVPVFLLGSDHSPLAEDQVKACGASGTLAKPFETQGMIDRVRQAFAVGAGAPAPAPAPATTAMFGAASAARPAAVEPQAARPAPAGAATAPGRVTVPLGAARPFATTVTNAAPPPPSSQGLAARPAAPPVGARTAPLRPATPAVASPAGPSLSVDGLEEIQLEAGLLSELGPMPEATRPQPAPEPARPAPRPAPAKGPAGALETATTQPLQRPTDALLSRIQDPTPVRAPEPVAVKASPEPAPARPAPAPSPEPVQAKLAPAPAPPPTAAVAAVVAPAVTAAVAEKVQGLGLTPAQVEAITALTREVVERVVWEVVPTLAETMIREELKRLTAD
ncbi:MAG: response regulator [Deltaproteobacteria bacterium]|nr:response regulator [Deltaproteobacteria bacterium]